MLGLVEIWQKCETLGQDGGKPKSKSTQPRSTSRLPVTMCFRFRCDTESQYARWMAALRLAAKGKTMADSGYDAEVKSIQAFLAMQHPASQPVINPNSIDVNVEDYVAPRFLRKMKSKVQ